jgi:hypothetical protein
MPIEAIPTVVVTGSDSHATASSSGLRHGPVAYSVVTADPWVRRAEYDQLRLEFSTLSEMYRNLQGRVQNVEIGMTSIGQVVEQNRREVSKSQAQQYSDQAGLSFPFQPKSATIPSETADGQNNQFRPFSSSGCMQEFVNAAGVPPFSQDMEGSTGASTRMADDNGILRRRFTEVECLPPIDTLSIQGHPPKLIPPPREREGDQTMSEAMNH